MERTTSVFDERELLRELKHYLPAQAPLKDFIHHNSLHAFQEKPFFEALKSASDIFGYKTFLSLGEFRSLHQKGRINDHILNRILEDSVGKNLTESWKHKLTQESYDENIQPNIGLLRAFWKKKLGIDLESFVQPLLFRILCSYLDQGIAIWEFPLHKDGFLATIRQIEENSSSSFFKGKKAKELLFNENTSITLLLKLIVGEESYFEQYIFDQQFSHQGWSGMVSVVEDMPETLLVTKKISLREIIIFELLLEIDTLDDRFKGKWKPLCELVDNVPEALFNKRAQSELDTVLMLWQQAFEWSFYDQVLTGIQSEKVVNHTIEQKSFQAAFCIDDRECSLRRYIESFDLNAETYGTPGFFGVEFYFQPEGGKFTTKVCPGPITPKYLIKESGAGNRPKKDIHFSKHSHNFIFGWFLTQTIGFWSAFKLLINIFKPTMSPATASSLKHMDKNASLVIENKDLNHKEHNLQVGFTIEEMAVRVENVLKSIGLIGDFAPIIYIVGHGASSTNNPHYAAYDCGACSGRAGSVNARVFSFMANHKAVREILAGKEIHIPAKTQFVGAISDTTRDEIVFFDTENLIAENVVLHKKNSLVFEKALDYNAKERSRRFDSIDSKQSAQKIHQKILTRSVSLFEPRPELNHATNAMCIVGRRELSKGVFLDRRSFLNSYDYSIDPEGNYLLNILNAATPVCGGINLEYYFSRVDNQKLGAGTKLPHNVMGLFGVANGIDGDLRPGLPSQMIEVHDPVRLLMIVEHLPEVVLNTIKRNPATYEWYRNDWITLVVVHPETKEMYLFKNENFKPYSTVSQKPEMVSNIEKLVESHEENFPIFLIEQH
ncbi:MAG: DUF2309 domain-containing protein [Bacteroidota bacterium]